MRAIEVVKALSFMTVGAAAYAQTAHPPSAPEVGVTREVLFDEKAFRATRTSREGGSVEAPGAHAMDVLIIPTSEGSADVSVAGKNQGDWKVGRAFFIPRNTDHHFANTGKTPIQYVAVSIY
jgi:mannose-6-phosphate isomerase-like protein (cupin superfamily)